MSKITKNILYTSHIQFFQILSSIIFIPLFLDKYGVESYAIYTISATLLIYISILEPIISARLVSGKANENEVLILCHLSFLIITILNIVLLNFIFSNIVNGFKMIIALSLLSSAPIYMWYIKIKFQVKNNYIAITNYFPIYNILKLYFCYFWTNNIEVFILVNMILSFLSYLPFVKSLLFKNFDINEVKHEIKKSKGLIKLNIYGYFIGNIDKYLLAALIEPKMYGVYMLINNVSAYIRVLPSQINNVFFVKKDLELKKLNIKLNYIVILISIIVFSIPVFYLTEHHLIFKVMNENYMLYFLFLFGYTINIIYSTYLNYKIIENDIENLTKKLEFIFLFLTPLSILMIFNFNEYGGALFFLLLNTIYIINYANNRTNNNCNSNI